MIFDDIYFLKSFLGNFPKKRICVKYFLSKKISQIDENL